METSGLLYLYPCSPFLASPKGTKIIAQGKAEGRHPVNASQNDTDPVRVEQTNTEAKNPVAIAPGSDTADLTKTPTPISLASPKGTKIIAQGKAEGRNPGITTQNDTDPVRVEQTNAAIAPLQGAEDIADRDPGFHPGLLSSSPTATRTTTPFSISRSFRDNSRKCP